jgi:orotate phosphoribosyltransferase
MRVYLIMEEVFPFYHGNKKSFSFHFHFFIFLFLSNIISSYAQAVHDSGLQFDVIFGPAYKGIPLVTAFTMAWYELYQESKDICYNRKEAKDHGEVSRFD